MPSLRLLYSAYRKYTQKNTETTRSRYNQTSFAYSLGFTCGLKTICRRRLYFFFFAATAYSVPIAATSPPIRSNSAAFIGVAVTSTRCRMFQNKGLGTGYVPSLCALQATNFPGNACPSIPLWSTRVPGGGISAAGHTAVQDTLLDSMGDHMATWILEIYGHIFLGRPLLLSGWACENMNDPHPTYSRGVVTQVVLVFSGHA